MQQLTSSEHGEHARKLNELFRSVSGTPSRVTPATVLDGMRKRVVGIIREVTAPTSPHKWRQAGKNSAWAMAHTEIIPRRRSAKK